MSKEISNEMFVKEFQILWQNTNWASEDLGNMIRGYFEGERAEKIINKMQETIKE